VTDKPGISLRDAAVRLSPDPGNREYSKLLGLLKAGRIKAGIRFPAPDPLWVEIPREFWLNVDAARFRNRLRSRNDTPSSGTFKVELADFAKEIGELIGRRSEPESSERWATVLAATGKRYEVEIIQEEWDRFSEANPQYIAPPPQGSTRGRSEKEGWRDTSVYIGAYIIRHYEASLEKIKSEEASDAEIKSGEASNKIHEIAKKAGTKYLPAAGSIQRVISEILTKARTISIN
jgi:hypothetical protein